MANIFERLFQKIFEGSGDILSPCVTINKEVWLRPTDSGWSCVKRGKGCPFSEEKGLKPLICRGGGMVSCD